MGIRVVLKSIRGHMGYEIANAIANHPSMTLVCGISSSATGPVSLLPVNGRPAATVPCYCSLPAALECHEADTYVDFSHASQAVGCVELAISSGLRVLTGTTGIPEAALVRLGDKAASSGLGLIYSPNFALGAVIMIQAAKLAAQYLGDIEIIELHHPGKADSPSGTAIHSAEAIARVRIDPRIHDGGTYPLMPLPPCTEPARGVSISGIRIHSVRLPGLVAHQEIIFGGLDETLTLRHDSVSRRSFIPGIVLALERLPRCKGLIHGLEELLSP